MHIRLGFIIKTLQFANKFFIETTSKKKSKLINNDFPGDFPQPPQSKERSLKDSIRLVFKQSRPCDEVINNIYTGTLRLEQKWTGRFKFGKEHIVSSNTRYI